MCQTASLAEWSQRPLRERKIRGLISAGSVENFFRGGVIPVTVNNDASTATLSGAWRYRVSAGTGWPGVSILWLGTAESLIRNFCLSVTTRKIV